MSSSGINIYVSTDFSFEMAAYVRRSAEQHAAGATRDRGGRMSKLAFLIVRRLSPGELLIFMQKRQ